ncbi:hypothetical protein [Catenisphaera adipataccumulans]|jgi:peptidoglycan/LPS O-acetylase OafA/YrhL|uniref:Peptidoglycan/LPS O-acetylase OafA/YrhL n=1 Tax=Catenisphaera adipataccumulans TaxID=700500 RepID=A0A7W8CW66_9FIRM|nr:hypothetical protein [Catenisphaera adipataccumulans]MBB5182446.1 peptidoglycan/LPS O-acetylase OafA/YrhL [Catenisphaera adipataccumulans]
MNILRRIASLFIMLRGCLLFLAVYLMVTRLGSNWGQELLAAVQGFFFMVLGVWGVQLKDPDRTFKWAAATLAVGLICMMIGLINYGTEGLAEYLVFNIALPLVVMYCIKNQKEPA